MGCISLKTDGASLASSSSLAAYKSKGESLKGMKLSGECTAPASDQSSRYGRYGEPLKKLGDEQSG